MKQSKQTKRTLVLSVLSVVLCLAMLVGTTFAWFTDTASTSVKDITSGKLNVALEYLNDNNEWVSAEGQTLNFKVSGALTDDAILWEPGCTYELPTLRVVNYGNLALKYKLTITGIQGSATLNEVIDWTIELGGETYNMNDEHKLGAMVGETALYDELTLKGHMQETAGNDYQNLTISGITISVVATQDTVESDSKDNTYDTNAQYPVLVSNQDEMNDAITNAVAEQKTTIVLPAGTTVTLDNGIANEGAKSRDLTFVGDGTQTFDVVTNAVSAEGGQLNYQRGSSLTFENMTIQAGEGSFDGIVADELTYKDCIIKGKLTLYGKATFINCTFDNTMENQYSIWTWGGTDVTFENCTFNTNGKAILLYGQATAENPTNLVVNNCTFTDRNNGTAGKAAIEVGNDYGATYTLSVNNATVNGFAAGKNTGSTLWANKNSMDAEHLTVTIDGTKVQ